MINVITWSNWVLALMSLPYMIKPHTGIIDIFICVHINVYTCMNVHVYQSRENPLPFFPFLCRAD